MTECETCGFEIQVGEQVETGELISCTDCGVEYEVVSLTPILLKEAPIIEEDFGQ